MLLVLLMLMLQSNTVELDSHCCFRLIFVAVVFTVPARRNVLVETIGTFIIGFALIRFGLLRRRMVASDQAADRTTHLFE
jgi:branched-subunit amino acid permease